METERKLDVLADIARALNQSGVTWAVGGSLLLYFKGKTGVFRDIDLMVCETDVEKLKQAMLPQGASGLFSDALFRGAERAVRAARPHLRVLVLFAAAAGLWCLLPRLFCPGRHPVFVLRHTGRRRKHKWIGSMILQRWRRC